jgi:hypothetical protein
MRMPVNDHSALGHPKPLIKVLLHHGWRDIKPHPTGQNQISLNLIKVLVKKILKSTSQKVQHIS